MGFVDCGLLLFVLLVPVLSENPGESRSRTKTKTEDFKLPHH